LLLLMFHLMPMPGLIKTYLQVRQSVLMAVEAMILIMAQSLYLISGALTLSQKEAYLVMMT